MNADALSLVAPFEPAAGSGATLRLCQLFLDQSYALSGGWRLDPASLLIAVTAYVRHAEQTGRGASGAMSRRAISEATGLARETVRRRVSRLVAVGLLEGTEGGPVRPSPLLIARLEADARHVSRRQLAAVGLSAVAAA
jgi:hypothetical protein